MLNLYANAIDQNGFMSLVSKNVNDNSKYFESQNRKIISSFVVVSLIFLLVITSGVEFQQNVEQEKLATMTSYINAV